MSENNPPLQQWPPRRHRQAAAPGTTLTTLSTPATPTKPPTTPIQSSSTKKRRYYRNGWESSPKTPSYKPYALTFAERRRARLASGPLPPKLKKRRPLLPGKWDMLAKTAGLIPDSSQLREFQVEAANIVVSRSEDLCVVAPTGAGKSMLWCLPLLVAKTAISLVITPYTNLGLEGEHRMRALGLTAIFIHSTQKSEALIDQVTAGKYRVVFICVEMLESPRFAYALHSKAFQCLVQAIYIDEAHLVHESLAWRTAYGRLLGARQVIGDRIPLVAISATLPTTYRKTLQERVGFRPTYKLINLGNFRPELSIAIIPLRYDISSFQDLAYLVPLGARHEDLIKTVIYCDDRELLTKMLWWLVGRLQAGGLSDELVDILHGGLSDTNNQIVLDKFSQDRTVFLLGTEKIGAGMNLPRVCRVVQYLARSELTLPKLDQRRGRGARAPGMTAVGHFFVEPGLLDQTSKNTNGAIDAGILALIRTKACYQDVLDRWLENPPRPRPFTRAEATRLCCSRCHPQLLPPQEHQWIMVDFSASSSALKDPLSDEEKVKIYQELCRLRMEKWRSDWRSKWPSFGPTSLLADADLLNVAKVANTITSVDDLRPLVKIIYWDDVAPWLASVAQTVASQVHTVAV